MNEEVSKLKDKKRSTCMWIWEWNAVWRLERCFLLCVAEFQRVSFKVIRSEYKACNEGWVEHCLLGRGCEEYQVHPLCNRVN